MEMKTTIILKRQNKHVLKNMELNIHLTQKKYKIK